MWTGKGCNKGHKTKGYDGKVEHEREEMQVAWKGRNGCKQGKVGKGCKQGKVGKGCKQGKVGKMCKQEEGRKGKQAGQARKEVQAAREGNIARL